MMNLPTVLYLKELKLIEKKIGEPDSVSSRASSDSDDSVSDYSDDDDD